MSFCFVVKNKGFLKLVSCNLVISLPSNKVIVILPVNLT